MTERFGRGAAAPNEIAVRVGTSALLRNRVAARVLSVIDLRLGAVPN